MNIISSIQTKANPENIAHCIEEAATIGGLTALALSTLQGIALLHQAPTFPAVDITVSCCLSGLAYAISKKIDLKFLQKHLRIDHAHTVHDIINSRLLHLPLFTRAVAVGLHATPFLIANPTKTMTLLGGMCFITSLASISYTHKIKTDANFQPVTTFDKVSKFASGIGVYILGTIATYGSFFAVTQLLTVPILIPAGISLIGMGLYLTSSKELNWYQSLGFLSSTIGVSVLAIKTASVLRATVSLTVPLTIAGILYLTSDAAYNYKLALINNINFSIKPGYYNAALQWALTEEREEENDLSRITQWLECSANQGVEQAQCTLGQYYLFGENGFQKDIQKGIELLKPLVAKNHVFAMYSLGLHYYKNGSVTEGIDLLTAVGNAQPEIPEIPQMKKFISPVQFLLYRHFWEQGQVKIADEWLRKAAENGLAEAQCTLAENFYLHSNRQEVLKWLHLAKAQGYPLSYYLLGLFYSEINNFKEAKNHFTFLLSLNTLEGQILGNIGLGHYYFLKDNQNYSNLRSRQHFLNAYNAGDEGIAYEIAQSYLLAAPPHQNLTLSNRFMKIAAKAGIPEAMGYVLQNKSTGSDS